jgi:hypothetical protein
LDLPSPDWAFIGKLNDAPAATMLEACIRDLDGIEKQVFAVRGRALLMMEERQLWKLLTDPATKAPWRSLDAWLASAAPHSRSDCYAALRAVRELQDVPFETLTQMPRCNVEQLRKVSSGVRARPEVQAAARELPEKDFVEKLNREHGQHLEPRKLVLLPPAGEVEELEQALEMAMLVEGCSTLTEALRCLAISYIAENFLAYEILKGARKA